MSQQLIVKTRGVAPATPKQPRRRLSCVEPGSTWENAYVASFNGRLREELLNVEIFDTLWEAQVLVERWRKHYNTVRPHSLLG
jgi:transposase InsO family protein